jgi:hypothetical protein
MKEIVENGLNEVVHRQALRERIQELRLAHSKQPTCTIPELQCLLASVLHGGRFNFFRGFGGKAVSPIIGDRPIDDGSAVDTFPGIEGQEKVRESFQLHQSFALRAIHNHVLPR